MPSEKSAPCIGLALGSGAARGLCHIGVLKVLEREKIRINCLAGTSIGAFIGALYAAGMSPEQMEEVATGLDWKRLARLIDPVVPTAGLIDGAQVAEFMAKLLPARTFEELRMPLAVTATDVETGEALIIRRGNLVDALRAAIAFPGIFTPVRFGDRFLIDGGLCNPVPVDAVKQLGAKNIIAVCAIPQVEKPIHETYLPPAETPARTSKRRLPLFNTTRIEKIFGDLWRARPFSGQQPPAEKPEKRPPSIFKVCAQSVAIMENQINQLRLQQNHFDVLIRPEFDDLTMLEFHRAAEAIAAGEKATQAARSDLAHLRC
jgi:NTE family protein